jgi:hypothetical protein
MDIKTALLELSETPDGKSGLYSVRFAIGCAQRVLPIYQNSENSDDSPAQAIQAAINVADCLANSAYEGIYGAALYDADHSAVWEVDAGDAARTANAAAAWAAT